MQFGHLGSNHPVEINGVKKALITAQNHGFSIEEFGDSFEHENFGNINVFARNLNDGSNEGFSLWDSMAYSVQFHPESGPGTTDGLHTIAVDLNGFIGTIKIQGSLETTPTATDWFDAELSDGEYTIDTTGKVTEIIVNNLTYAVAETSIKAYNTTGNFVWLRADVSNWTGGTITRIELNR